MDHSGKAPAAAVARERFEAAGEEPPGSKLWPKAGWTRETRHDAAYVELPNGARFVLVTFTVDHASEREIIPAVAKAVVEEFSAPE